MARVIRIILLCSVWAGFPFLAHAETGYRYNGKTPGEWLAEIVNYTNQSAALSAFQAMGTNAHPALLNGLIECDSTLRNLYIDKYPKLPGFIRKHLSVPMTPKDIEFAVSLVLLNSDSRPLMAKALKILEDASPDVRYTIISGLQNKVQSSDVELAPSFASALTDTNSHTRVAALHCLGKIGSGASSQTNAVINCLIDKDPWVRVNSAYALWNISRQTNQAVPVLRSAFDQTYPVRHWAACYLLNMSGRAPPADLIPVFIGSLQQQSDEGVRSSACYCLLRYGADAKAAVPQLLPLLQDKSRMVREAATNCLKKISPESLEK